MSVHVTDLAPEERFYGWEWAGNGWTVKLNRHGDVYPSDSRISREELPAFLAAMEAAFDFWLRVPADA